MPAEITYREYREYILVEVQGSGRPEFVLPQAQIVWRRMSDLCRSLGKSRVLLVVNLQNHIPIGMSMDLARLAEENGWARQYKLAIVTDLENQMSMDLMKSFLIHRGYEARVFRNARTARKWLTSD